MQAYTQTRTIGVKHSLHISSLSVLFSTMLRQEPSVALSQPACRPPAFMFGQQSKPPVSCNGYNDEQVAQVSHDVKNLKLSCDKATNRRSTGATPSTAVETFQRIQDIMLGKIAPEDFSLVQQALATEGKSIKVFIEGYFEQLLISNGKETLGLCVALYPSLLVHREVLAGRMPPAQVNPRTIAELVARLPPSMATDMAQQIKELRRPLGQTARLGIRRSGSVQLVASLMAEVAQQLVLTIPNNNNDSMYQDPNTACDSKKPCSPPAAHGSDTLIPPVPTSNTPYSSSSSSTPSAPCDSSAPESKPTHKQSPAPKKTNAEIDAERAAMLERCRAYTTPAWYEKTKALMCPQAYLNGDICKYYADINAEVERFSKLLRGSLTAPATVAGLQPAVCSVDAMQVDSQPCYSCYSWDSEDSEYEYEVVVEDSDDDGEEADGGGFD